MSQAGPERKRQPNEITEGRYATAPSKVRKHKDPFKGIVLPDEEESKEPKPAKKKPRDSQ